MCCGLMMDKIMNPKDVSRGVERCPIPLENPADVTDVLDFVVSCSQDVFEDSIFHLSVPDTGFPRRGSPIPEVGAKSYGMTSFCVDSHFNIFTCHHIFVPLGDKM